MVLAKKKIENGRVIYQDLYEHTFLVVESAFDLIDQSTLQKVANYVEEDEEKIVDLIFFSAYFHDIGKATDEFQETIKNDKKSYHSLYSASLFFCDENFLYEDINLLVLNILTHHTLFPYSIKNVKFNFLDEAKEFFKNYKKIYEKVLQKECRYNFEFKVNNSYVALNELEDDLKYIREFKTLDKLRVLYSYTSGILNVADWIASAKFNNTLVDLISIKQKLKFNFELRDFQKNLATSNTSVLVEIPTGEGKTEGALLWANSNILNKNTKIIYTLPTSTTSNKLYERVVNIFNKSKCTLLHSSSRLYLEEKYENEDDNVFRSEMIFSSTFNKAITVSTLDSLLKYFINLDRFNITTKNFFNSLIILDEIHSYDLKLMGFLKRFLEICDAFNVKVCLMSASIPNRIKKLLNLDRYKLITQKELFEKKAIEIKKRDYILDEDIEAILEKYQENKKVLVIRNTISKAQETFEILEDKADVILYHSAFKKIDRAKKEELIFNKLNEQKPFILIATQVVEVSLDIDFDVMFSDLAPIDSLIQRFGRVNRKKSPNKGEVYIYQVKNVKPYRDFILDATFKYLEDGYFSIKKYNEWLNKVYDEIFSNKVFQNELKRLFEDGYNRFEKEVTRLNGIEKNKNFYDLRDITYQKNDYLLYEDYMNDNIDFKYTVSLPIWLEKQFLYKAQRETFYKILKVDYSFEKGVTLPKLEGFSFDFD